MLVLAQAGRTTLVAGVARLTAGSGRPAGAGARAEVNAVGPNASAVGSAELGLGEVTRFALQGISIRFAHATGCVCDARKVSQKVAFVARVGAAGLLAVLAGAADPAVAHQVGGALVAELAGTVERVRLGAEPFPLLGRARALIGADIGAAQATVTVVLLRIARITRRGPGLTGAAP